MLLEDDWNLFAYHIPINKGIWINLPLNNTLFNVKVFIQHFHPSLQELIVETVVTDFIGICQIVMYLGRNVGEIKREKKKYQICRPF